MAKVVPLGSAKINGGTAAIISQTGLILSVVAGPAGTQNINIRPDQPLQPSDVVTLTRDYGAGVAVTSAYSAIERVSPTQLTVRTGITGALENAIYNLQLSRVFKG